LESASARRRALKEATAVRPFKAIKKQLYGASKSESAHYASPNGLQDKVRR
jgi:hypothetical protein